MKFDSNYQTPAWHLPLIILGVLAFSSTLIFWFSDVDIRCAAIFYAPYPALNPWPQELASVWRLFYYGAPVLVACIALGAVAILVAGHRKSQWRRAAVYVLLTLAIGPGLLVNLVFKDHWGRPRPRQIAVFGGTLPYLPPLALGASSEEKSFPAGHASVGFSLCTFWFLWRQRRPRYAWIALLLSLGLGLVMGLGRMAAGAHFLSDVLWAGFISFFAALVLYYFVLRIPHHEAQAPMGVVEADQSGFWKIIYVSIGIVVLGGALLGFPVHEVVDYRLPPELPTLPPNLHLELRYVDLTINLSGSQTPPLYITGYNRGFGLPTYKIDSHSYWNPQTKTLVYSLKQRGFFTELDTHLHVVVDATKLRKLSVLVQDGDIHIVADPSIHLPQLDLKTNHGRVWPLIRK